MKDVRSSVMLMVLTVVLVLVGCGLGKNKEFVTNDRGLDKRNMDTTCSPCRDFNLYANGGWLARNTIPGDYPYWGSSQEVIERNKALLRGILEDAAKGEAEHGSTMQKIGDFYFSAMDSARIESEGFRPIQPYLDKIEALNTADDVVRFIMTSHSEGDFYLFASGSLQDMENSDAVILYIVTGGLGLPDRDYYTREDDESVELRNKYIAHMTNMFKLLGYPESTAREDAETVLRVETRLAGVTLTAVEKNEPANWYGPMTVTEADELTPNFSWQRYLEAIGLPQLESFSMAPEKFFAELSAMLVDVPANDWKPYFRWHLVDQSGPYLSSAFVNEGFSFYGKTLTGQEELSPRWKRAQGAVSGSMGEALGKLFVERTFSPEAKAAALDMVNNLKKSLRERIEGIDWMSVTTKEKALAKLDAFMAKIGYPDKWKDYSDLEIARGPWIENMRRATRFAVADDLGKIGKPPDRAEWVTNPHTVNAFYNPLNNAITFPAGILQPPFFDVEADDAVNYGCMGVVIGHEMTHGFDENGRRFDAAGNMVDWWTEEDDKKFIERADRMIAQFDEYVVIDSLHVNGELTLGENIADRGGLRIAYRALQMARAGKEDPMIDGLTQEQRFFLSFAQFFRANFKPEFLKLLVNTDTHTPHMFRINGPLSHMTEFANAFGCKNGDKMYTPPGEQVHVW